ncbi:glycosyltransferase [Pseudoflavitalea rhizosphaerae]|uniref:glycosyltransferase n=1 Tax=Pseudoflavitalea rhizosphaerae TaxID=1884793 RepID=UPI0013DFE150|nr:glycosyltransferase family 2 protein [Pseudoflavitalea rhizosphaerae]
MLPLVSIIIPVYNSEKFLSGTIRSAMEQQWPNKEIIIVDDGSTDQSLAIAKSFSAPMVKVISQPNKGACAARNNGMANASGDYFQFLDGDDLISPDKISKQMQIFAESGDDIVVSSRWVRFYDEFPPADLQAPVRPLDKDWPDPLEWLIASWENNWMGQTSIWLTSRAVAEKAGPWNEELPINQDGDYFCRVLLNSNGIRHCSGPVVYYRSANSNSITGAKSYTKADKQLYSYKLYEEYVAQYLNRPGMKHALMKNYLSFIYHYYGQYPDLISKAKQYVRDLGYKKLGTAGGHRFQQLAKLIGFEKALWLRKWFRHILSTQY